MFSVDSLLQGQQTSRCSWVLWIWLGSAIVAVAFRMKYEEFLHCISPSLNVSQVVIYISTPLSNVFSVLFLWRDGGLTLVSSPTEPCPSLFFYFLFQKLLKLTARVSVGCPGCPWTCDPLASTSLSWVLYCACLLKIRNMLKNECFCLCGSLCTGDKLHTLSHTCSPKILLMFLLLLNSL